MLNKEIANYMTYINHKPQRLKKKQGFCPTLTWKRNLASMSCSVSRIRLGRQEVLVVVGPNFWSRVEVG